MKEKTILFGAFLAAFVILMTPAINVVNAKVIISKNKKIIANSELTTKIDVNKESILNRLTDIVDKLKESDKLENIEGKLKKKLSKLLNIIANSELTTKIEVNKESILNRLTDIVDKLKESDKLSTLININDVKTSNSWWEILLRLLFAITVGLIKLFPGLLEPILYIFVYPLAIFLSLLLMLPEIFEQVILPIIKVILWILFGENPSMVKIN